MRRQEGVIGTVWGLSPTDPSLTLPKGKGMFIPGIARVEDYRDRERT